MGTTTQPQVDVYLSPRLYYRPRLERPQVDTVEEALRLIRGGEVVYVDNLDFARSVLVALSNEEHADRSIRRALCDGQ